MTGFVLIHPNYIHQDWLQEQTPSSLNNGSLIKMDFYSSLIWTFGGKHPEAASLGGQASSISLSSQPKTGGPLMVQCGSGQPWMPHGHPSHSPGRREEEGGINKEAETEARSSWGKVSRNLYLIGQI